MPENLDNLICQFIWGGVSFHYFFSFGAHYVLPADKENPKGDMYKPERKGNWNIKGESWERHWD